jgi:hypothetical protein
MPGLRPEGAAYPAQAPTPKFPTHRPQVPKLTVCYFHGPFALFFSLFVSRFDYFFIFVANQRSTCGLQCK